MSHFLFQSLLNGWNHVKKNISQDSSYQIYFTEIGSWICNLKELTQPAKRLPLSAVKAMVSFHIRCDRWCDRCILLSFLPSETVQNLSDLYETCDRENAEIVGLLGRRSLSPRVSPSLSPVLSCAHCVLPGACYGGRKLKSSIEDVIEFFNAVIPIHNFVQSRNSEGYFWQKHLPYPKTKENKI